MISQDFGSDAGRAQAEPPMASLTPALVGSAVVAALGGLLFGFDTAVFPPIAQYSGGHVFAFYALMRKLGIE